MIDQGLYIAKVVACVFPWVSASHRVGRATADAGGQLDHPALTLWTDFMAIEKYTWLLVSMCGRIETGKGTFKCPYESMIAGG